MANGRQLSNQDLETFHHKIQEAQKKYQVPGVAVTIVQNDKLIFDEGFGVRNLETKEPMTTETICPLGSMSKSLTALMNATQVDEGHFTWDTYLKDISPLYRFPTDLLTETLQVYHLMSMSSGLSGPTSPYDHYGQYDENAIYWNEQSPAYLMTSLATSQILGEPGTVFYYNNEVYASAGYLRPLQQGMGAFQLLQAYKDLMYKKVFHPIGMKNTYITSDLSCVSHNYAVSYGLQCQNETLKPLTEAATSVNNINGLAPAGQIVSNAKDLSLYARMLLNSGIAPNSGHRVVSTKNLQELWNPRINTKGGIPGLTNDIDYGLGWEIDEITYNGHKFEVYCHGGFLPAWLSWIQVVPDSNVGLVILTNNAFGRYLALEMGQELLQLVYGEDLKFDVNVDHYYREAIRDAIEGQGSHPASYKVKREDVAPILGNYQGGWTVEIDSHNHLLVSKTGWIYYLFPSQAGSISQGKNEFIVWASNDSQSLEKNKNRVEFYIDSVWGVTMISGMGEVKRWAA